MVRTRSGISTTSGRILRNGNRIMGYETTPRRARANSKRPQRINQSYKDFAWRIAKGFAAKKSYDALEYGVRNAPAAYQYVKDKYKRASCKRPSTYTKYNPKTKKSETVWKCDD